MITPASLRSLIFRTIGSQIGSYRLPDSEGVTPAIAVLPDPDLGYNYPPTGTITTGLEIRIRTPLHMIEPLLGNVPMVSPRWEIRLLQRDVNGSAIATANALLPVLSRELDCEVSNPVLIPPNPEKDIPEQIVINLVEHLI